MTTTHLDLRLNDLIHPTEKSVSILETLSTSQLDNIQQTLNKIKQKKLKQQKEEQQQQQKPNVSASDWAFVAAQIAKAFTNTMATASTNNESMATAPTTVPAPSKPSKSSANAIPNHEPRTETKDGVEWVSFVYSHHRVLRRYSIRTDIEKVDVSMLDDKFKNDNCVYPRANLPREEYKGNRWAYETECNTLGWKLAYLNLSEISGKRGLIQRAVDSYRNRYPSMRSRRVARQEKLLKGTLRKRKQRDSEDVEEQRPVKKTNTNTVMIDDGSGKMVQINIDIDSVSLDAIDAEFREANCVYRRALDVNPCSPFASQRQIEEAKCNEIAWKLAYLNPEQLAGRKNLLQRVLDVYRAKFLSELSPRKHSVRMLPAQDTNIVRTDEPSLSPEASPVYQNIMLSIPASTDELLASGRLSISSSSSEESIDSPYMKMEDDLVYKDNSLDMYPLSSSIDFDPSEYIKIEEDQDPLINQLFVM